MKHRIAATRFGVWLTLAAGALTAHAQLVGGAFNAATYKAAKLAGHVPAGFHYNASPPEGGNKVVPHGTLRGGGGNVCECWIPPDGSWTLAMAPNDDGSSAQIFLPFAFNLYGDQYTSCYINNNGNISFGGLLGSFTAQTFPIASDQSQVFNMVAPYWEDVDTYGAGQVWYKVTPTALYVDWVGVGYFSSHTDLLNTFSLIITDGNDPVIGIGKNTRFCYQDMQWSTGDIWGSNGFGSPGTVGANRGNGIDFLQIGTFDHAGTDYDGPFGNPDGISWLDNQEFVFTTAVSTSNIPPIGSGDYLCDTVHVCAGEQVVLSMQFLSPESDQTTTATSSAPDFSNYTETVNTPGQTALITGQFTPLATETGFHVVTFQATDNGAPNLTSTYNIVVDVQIAAVMEPGDLAVCDNGPAVDMYALLGGSPLPGGVWTDPNGIAHTATFLPGEDVDGGYVYAVGNGGNCPNTGVVTMTTVGHADAGVDVALSHCTSDAQDVLFAHLGGTPQNGGLWYTPGGANFNGTLQPGAAVSGNYDYVITGISPCPTDTSHVAVTIQQAVDPGSNAGIALCADADPLFMLNALNGNADATGNWTAPGGGAFGNNFTAAVDAPGVYTYSVPATLPCPTLSSTLTIAVDPRPDAGNDNGLALCADAGNTSLFPHLGGSPDAGGHWLDPFGAAHSGVLDPSLGVSGDYTYIAIGPGTCQHLSDSARITVTVNPLPIISFTADPDSGCNPLTVHLTNTTDPLYVGNSCMWDLGDGTTGVNECGTLEHIYQDAGWYNVNLTVTTPQGCTDHLIIPGAVLVEQAPTAAFSWTPDPGTEENSNILFSAEDPHATEFHWDLMGIDSSDQRQVYHDFPHELGGDYRVCLSVADRYGCADVLCDTVSVIVPTLYVPNSFTPNGDGINDTWAPISRDMVDRDHELMIFDRWGQSVFDSTDPTLGWDGHHANGGEVLPQGVYAWRLIERLKSTSDKRDWFGTVTLLK